MNPAILKATSLTKRFGHTLVLDNFNLSLTAGNYALQGPNGIGKSSLLKVLSGAMQPDDGEILINSINMNDSPLEARTQLSYVPDESPLYPFLKGTEFLNFIAKVKKNAH